jgi:lysyl-tRNA synthetase class 2
VSTEESELLAVRRRKLEALREAGIDPFPHAFGGVTPVAEAKAPHEGLEDGEETDVRVRVAGRLHARRGQGKMAFLDLDDRTGRIQLQARRDVLGDEAFERLLTMDLGDLIGADGTIFKTRRGELSVAVSEWTLLAKSLRPPPEKHHGLTDTETRFRHRELDLMSNPDTRETFLTRAKIVSAIRRFLDEEGFIEVETPVLQPIYGGALARPFVTHFNALEKTMYLRIATELYLKRLIVGGLERVYELGKDFRNEGLSPKHNPEFTMLEWYEAYADWEVVAERAERLLRSVGEAIGSDKFAQPFKRETLAGSIQSRVGIDVLGNRTPRVAAGRDARSRHGDPGRAQLGGARGLPGVQARGADADRADDCSTTTPSSSRRSQSDTANYDGLVERFEAFADGMEVCQRVLRAQRSGRPARKVRGAGPARRGGRRERSAVRSRTTSTPSSTACRRPVASASASIAW